LSRFYPLRLAPSWREKIWGSQDLSPLFGYQSRRIGEVWYSFEANTITNGSWAGQTLRELMLRDSAGLMGNAFRPGSLPRRSTGEAGRAKNSTAPPYFPILVKFLFTGDKLSVQVHPDDAYAREHEDGPGKTEMWYVSRADPGACLALGLTTALTKDELREVARSGEIARYLNWVEVKQGDAIFSPPGTLHSIGPGLALCEIQQNSDLTYRFFDFGRLGEDGHPRPLHIDQAVEVTRLELHGAPEQRVSFHRGDLKGETLLVCDYFAVERLSRSTSLVYPADPSRMHLLVFLEGRGALGVEAYQPGDVYLIPAALPPCEWRPAEATVALRTYVPD